MNNCCSETCTTDLVGALAQKLLARGLRMAAAESCTGGLVSSMLTDLPGSSFWFEGAVVAYKNRVKTGLLHVSDAVLQNHGAVSGPCVEAMVCGVCDLLDVPVGVALSGIAGPDGGSASKPVGTVWMAWLVDGRVWSKRFNFQGARYEIKVQSAREAIRGLLGAVAE